MVQRRHDLPQEVFEPGAGAVVEGPASRRRSTSVTW